MGSMRLYNLGVRAMLVVGGGWGSCEESCMRHTHRKRTGRQGFGLRRREPKTL